MRRYHGGSPQNGAGDAFSTPRRPPPHNLPSQLTSFVGREREIAEVARLLEGARLVTLTGPGGCGKTRLALEAAAAVLATHPDGAWLAELAPLADPALVSQAVAAAVGVREVPGRPLTDTLASSLRPRRLLLVLDNCEHLVEACAHLVETLLRACPDLRVLATSREVLRIPGEVAWLVPPLSLPPAEGLPPDDLIRFQAVRLFVERAAAAASGFRLTERNAAAVAQVCRGLDGMPLAIELAAARVNVLSVEQIAARLDDSLRLLTAGVRTALPRHQTLLATIDWSHGLLPEPERALLRRLAVFAGGCTLEAVAAVCGETDGDEVAALGVLSRLVDKSLVEVREHGGTARYWLLETVRQYARDRLLASGEAEEVRRRHAAFFLRRAEAIAPRINTSDRARWLAELDADHDNLRAALRWSNETRDVESALRLVGALWWFWLHRGLWSEGRGWLEGAIAERQARIADVQPAASAPDPHLAHALVGAGWLAFAQGDHAAARTRLEESAGTSRALEDDWGLALPLGFLAVLLAHLGEYAAARRAGEEAVALFRTAGESWGLAVALLNLGVAAELRHDDHAAERLFEESAALFRDLGDGWGLSLPLRHAGYVAFRRRDYDRALALYRESLALCRALDEKWFASMGLEAVAVAVGALVDHDRAARLLGAAERLREALGAALRGPYRADYDRAVVAARAGLGEAAFAVAWAEGRALDPEQALTLALEPGAATTPTAGRPAGDAEAAGPLTRREREVAALVARGLTNRQIAERLFVTEKTAEAHVGHALAKLGLASRAQLAVWAVAHGLLANPAT